MVKDHPLTLKEHRDFLLFSSTLAAAKAIRGNIENFMEAEVGLEVPISSDGIKGLENFKIYCVGRKLCTLEEFESGYLYGPDHDAVIIPTKIVNKPKATVEIGDVISARTFAAMISKIKQKKE